MGEGSLEIRPDQCILIFYERPCDSRMCATPDVDEIDKQELKTKRKVRKVKNNEGRIYKLSQR